MDENTLHNLLSMRDAAKHVGLAYHTLVRLNSAGFGPPVAIQIASNRLYRVVDLNAWNADRLTRKAAAAA